jgi:putative colanic acid biosynthesis acetyltransferase WcaF
MAEVKLATYDNTWYNAGRSRFWQAAWFFIGLPLLRCSILPSSSIRVSLLRAFGARVGQRCTVKPGIRVKYPWRLIVGNDCWLGEDCWLDNLADVQLGNDVCVSQGAYLCTGNHDWSDSGFSLIVKSIVLRDGAWVGARAVVAPGVEIGECAIAASGSVVTRNVPAYQIHAGNPACFVRMREIRSQRRESFAVGD